MVVFESKVDKATRQPILSCPDKFRSPFALPGHSPHHAYRASQGSPSPAPSILGLHHSHLFPVYLIPDYLISFLIPFLPVYLPTFEDNDIIKILLVMLNRGAGWKPVTAPLSITLSPLSAGVRSGGKNELARHRRPDTGFSPGIPQYPFSPRPICTRRVGKEPGLAVGLSNQSAPFLNQYRSRIFE